MKFERYLSIPKSLYVCYKLFGFKRALGLPILVRYNTKIISLRGHVNVVCGGGKVFIGFGRISEFDKKHERSIIKLDGDIIIETPCYFGQGARIISEPKSKMFVGKNFNNTANLTISNRGLIEIGADCLISWNTWICDSSFHKMSDCAKRNVLEPNGKVVIGNHVWMCANSSILKGTSIPDNCVIATGSIVLHKFEESNCLIAGCPAIVKRHQINWSL